MIVGNIVTETNLKTPKEFQQVSSIEDIDGNIPTIIVGWYLIEKLFPDYDITNSKITKDIWWTFTPKERKDNYERDMRAFIYNSYSEMVNKINYVFIDPINYTPDTLSKIIKKIKELHDFTTYQHDDMIYMYSTNLLFGIDLKLLRFMKVDTEKTLNKIKENSVEFITKDDIFEWYLPYIDKVENQIKYIPYFHSLLQIKPIKDEVLG